MARYSRRDLTSVARRLSAAGGQPCLPGARRRAVRFRGVSRNDLGKQMPQSEPVPPPRGGDEVTDPRPLTRRRPPIRHGKYLLVRRGRHVVALGEQLLGQLFARPQTGERNADVAVKFQTRKVNQVLCQLNDRERLAHVEDERFSAFTQGGSLKDQLNRLRNG